MNYAFFLHLRASRAWLSLSREQRAALSSEHIAPILRRHEGTLRMRYFDAEAFTASCSDVMLLEAGELQPYYDFIEALRDTPLIAAGLFEVVQIVPTIEEGYRGYETRARSPSTGAPSPGASAEGGR